MHHRRTSSGAALESNKNRGIDSSVFIRFYQTPLAIRSTDAMRKFDFGDSAALRDGQRVRVTALETNSERW